MSSPGHPSAAPLTARLGLFAAQSASEIAAVSCRCGECFGGWEFDPLGHRGLPVVRTGVS